MMRLGTIVVALLAVCDSFAHADSKLPDQEYAPLKKKAPVYPHVSQFNGIEGYCIVEYTVTAQGTTQDVFPEACSPDGLFEGISVEAAKQFTYQPRILNGMPVRVAGVQNKFTFNLRGDGKRLDPGPDPIKFSFLKPSEQKGINKQLQSQDWKALKKYALTRKNRNHRMLYFAGYSELQMGNADAGYELMEQFVFHEDEETPFEYVTFSAVQRLAAHYYQMQQSDKLIALNQQVDIWWFRLIEPRETNRIALMIADTYGMQGSITESDRRFAQIVDRARTETEKADPFVAMARQALGQ
ncbi:energy transducer TonB [Luminiphilus sp.]|nr:energy transducer TonB [Luminiphilus sp.]